MVDLLVGFGGGEGVGVISENIYGYGIVIGMGSVIDRVGHKEGIGTAFVLAKSFVGKINLYLCGFFCGGVEC